MAHIFKPDIVCHCMIHLQYPTPNPILFHCSQCSSGPSRPWAGTSLRRVQRCARQPSLWCTREGTWCGCQSDGGHAGSCRRQSTPALWHRTDWVCPEGRERGFYDWTNDGIDSRASRGHNTDHIPYSHTDSAGHSYVRMWARTKQVVQVLRIQSRLTGLNVTVKEAVLPGCTSLSSG